MVFVSNTIQYNTIQYTILHKFLVPEQGIRFGFSTPEQGGKFKRPMAHTHLIKVESPLGNNMAKVCSLLEWCFIISI